MTENREQGDGPRVHTTPEEGHPAGDGERSDREVGGPTDPEQAPDEDVTGGAPGAPGDEPFDPHT